MVSCMAGVGSPASSAGPAQLADRSLVGAVVHRLLCPPMVRHSLLDIIAGGCGEGLALRPPMVRRCWIAFVFCTSGFVKLPFILGQLRDPSWYF